MPRSHAIVTGLTHVVGKCEEILNIALLSFAIVRDEEDVDLVTPPIATNVQPDEIRLHRSK